MNWDTIHMVAVIAGLLVFWLLSVIGANQAGCIEGRDVIRQEAIERGYAEYDKKTGDWKWKGDATE
jgi:hypothetical protein